jgi:hypothetical protein
VLVTEGEASLDGDRLEPFTLYVLAPGQAMTLSAETPSRDRINQAKEDWKARRFPLVPGDDQEFIPLPEVPLTVTYP